MADSVLYGRSNLPKSLGQSGWLKDRIVTEATSPMRLIEDRPFDCSLESAEHFAFAGQSKDTAKTRGEWTVPATLAQFGKESCNILAVLRARSGIARGINAGRALERIDFETGIVRDHQSGNPARDRDRFQNRVFDEGCARLFDHRSIRLCRQITDEKILPEDLGKLPGLMRIARGEEQTIHLDRIYRINWIRI
jgi:hypothetical protein